MMATDFAANSRPMSDEVRGHAIRARRLAHGIKSARAFAEATGVDRHAIARAEAGEASAATYERLEAWLNAFDEETGAEERPEPRVVIVRLPSGQGDIVVEGPIEDLAALEEAAMRLLKHMREES